MSENIPQQWSKFYLKDVTFMNLMTRRIENEDLSIDRKSAV